MSTLVCISSFHLFHQNPHQHIKSRTASANKKKQLEHDRLPSLKQPHIKEQEEHSGEKAQPDFPPDAGALRHAQHAGHVPAESYSRTLEGVLEGIEVCCVANFIADSYCHLEPGDVGVSVWPRKRGWAGLSAPIRSAAGGRELRTSFSIFTLAVIPSTSASFWDSSEERTASE